MMTSFRHALHKTCVVIGGSYGGNAAVSILAKSLPKDWKVILVDRNSHMSHVYALPRFAILPGHEYKGFIPYTQIFNRRLEEGEKPVDHEFVHGEVTSLSAQSVTVNVFGGVDSLPSSSSERGPRRIPFDYLVYALGAHLPAPINLWGTVPTQSFNKSEAGAVPSRLKGYEGFKPQGEEWLKKHQSVVKESSSVLVVGGGALGIQYATDIKAVHPEKQVTLLHSRKQLLPRFFPELHDEAHRRMSEAGIDLVLGHRLDLRTVNEEPAHRNATGQRIVKTEDGLEIAADLILLCTGQRPATELLASLDERLVVPSTRQARILRSMQVAFATPENLPVNGDYSVIDKQKDSPYPHIFAVGDTADAFGAIEAGHTAHFMTEVAARNILKLIDHEHKIKEGHAPEGSSPELEAYKPGLPGIKVSLGLRRAVVQSDGEVSYKDDGVDDLQASYMWQAMGHKLPTDEEMHL